MHKSNSWSIEKRFSEIELIQNYLSNNFSLCPLLKGKSFFNIKEDEQIEQRRQNVEIFLKSICLRKDILNDEETQKFFEMPIHINDYKYSTLKTDRALEKKFEFGIFKFILRDDKGFFITAENDENVGTKVSGVITSIFSKMLNDISYVKIYLNEDKPLDFNSYTLNQVLNYQNKILQIALSDSCKYLLVGHENGEIHINSYNFESKKFSFVQKIIAHKGTNNCLAFLRNEDTFISAGEDKAIISFNLESKDHKKLKEIVPMKCLHVDNSRRRLFFGGANGMVGIYEISESEIMKVALFSVDNSQAITQIIFDKKSNLIICGSKEGRVFVIGLEREGNEQLSRTIKIYDIGDEIRFMVWMREINEIIIGNRKGLIKFYKIDPLYEFIQFEIHKQRFTQAKYLEKTNQLLCSSYENFLTVTDLTIEWPHRSKAEPFKYNQMLKQGPFQQIL